MCLVQRHSGHAEQNHPKTSLLISQLNLDESGLGADLCHQAKTRMRLPSPSPSLTQAKMIYSSLIDTSYRSSLTVILGALAKQGSLGSNISWWLQT